MSSFRRTSRAGVALRLGSGLVASIDAAADAEGQSRTDWLSDALEAALETTPRPVLVALRDVLVDRRPILLRVDRRLLARIDRRRRAEGVSRTIWMIEAIVRRLGGYTFTSE